MNKFQEILDKSIDFVRAPDQWVAEGTEQPSDQCREKTKKIFSEIFRLSHQIPDRFGASIEGGIFLAYEGSVMCLFIEVYNDGEACYVLNDQVKKEIVDSGDISDMQLDNMILKAFVKTQIEHNDIL